MLANYSTWNCVDLHIHSIYSNNVKKNDYDGNECNGKTFLNNLKNNKVNIFSITDHNCINTKLYNEIETLVSTDEYKEIINYIIGVELDIKDTEIYEEVFHCLCFFETRNINLAKKCVDDIFDNLEESKRNTEDVYPTINKIFEKFHLNKISNIVLIPHFNNKSKGIPQDIAVSHLNYLCFNAYEDSNNIKNIQKSLNVYLQAGFDNFPFAVFTDNHNIRNYPVAKDGSACLKCFMLSNINHPFNSIKTAFEEPRLRISIEKVENMRSTECPSNFINKLIINDFELDLSPYQNTIIGKFGSGKSLLLDKIRGGEVGLKTSDKYSELYNSNNKFKVCTKTQIADSLGELMSQTSVFVHYDFFQQEDYYHSNQLDEKNLISFLKRVNLQYSLKEEITFSFNEKEIAKSYKDLESIISNQNVKNNLNYEKAFDNQQYYNVEYSNVTDNLSTILIDLEKYNKDLEGLKIIKLYDEIQLFNNNEIEELNEIVLLIEKKVKLIQTLQRVDFINNLKQLIDDYQTSFVKNEEKTGLNSYRNNLNDFANKIVRFKKECNNFQNTLSEDKYNSYKSKKIQNVFSDYDIASYFDNIPDYQSPIDMIIKDKNRIKSNLFQSVLKSFDEETDKRFMSNKDFEYNIKKYCERNNQLFKREKIKYDVLKSNESMLKKSAGEKSSLFIELLFKKIEDDLDKGKNVILIIDQPEDNIDNENILREITNKIKNFKVLYNNFQSIIVTHNANVGITADSENIIIAKEKILDGGLKTFEYESGCIENTDYIKRVCNILEGGIEAMKQRTEKYGINIIKKVKENEA